VGYVHWDQGESEDLDVVDAACAGELPTPGSRSGENGRLRSGSMFKL
jgi:hypothetical protein